VEAVLGGGVGGLAGEVGEGGRLGNAFPSLLEAPGHSLPPRPLDLERGGDNKSGLCQKLGPGKCSSGRSTEQRAPGGETQSAIVMVEERVQNVSKMKRGFLGLI
jgi:hypothetical protein